MFCFLLLTRTRRQDGHRLGAEVRVDNSNAEHLDNNNEEPDVDATMVLVESVDERHDLFVISDEHGWAMRWQLLAPSMSALIVSVAADLRLLVVLS